MSCTICRENYDFFLRRPVFACDNNHTFCAECLRKMSEEKKKEVKPIPHMPLPEPLPRNCPLCRQIVPAEPALNTDEIIALRVKYGKIIEDEEFLEEVERRNMEWKNKSILKMPSVLNGVSIECEVCDMKIGDLSEAYICIECHRDLLVLDSCSREYLTSLVSKVICKNDSCGSLHAEAHKDRSTRFLPLSVAVYVDDQFLMNEQEKGLFLQKQYEELDLLIYQGLLVQRIEALIAKGKLDTFLNTMNRLITSSIVIRGLCSQNGETDIVGRDVNLMMVRFVSYFVTIAEEEDSSVHSLDLRLKCVNLFEEVYNQHKSLKTLHGFMRIPLLELVEKSIEECAALGCIKQLCIFLNIMCTLHREMKVETEISTALHWNGELTSLIVQYEDLGQEAETGILQTTLKNLNSLVKPPLRARLLRDMEPWP